MMHTAGVVVAWIVITFIGSTVIGLAVGAFIAAGKEQPTPPPPRRRRRLTAVPAPTTIPRRQQWRPAPNNTEFWAAERARHEAEMRAERRRS
jgi:hypothetical protein